MTSATPRTFLYQSAKRVLDALQSGHNPTFEEIDKLSAAIQEYENGNEQSESSALSQAQQALRDEIQKLPRYPVHLWCGGRNTKEFQQLIGLQDVLAVIAALPSDTPGAQ